MVDITASGAVWGGFHTFFSVWQSCVMQISPFFMAFMVGLLLAGKEERMPTGSYVLLPVLLFIPGFALFYSLVNSAGLTVNRYLFNYIDTLRFLSGLYIILAGLFLIAVGRLEFLRKNDTPRLRLILSLLLGASFALVYMPCINPVLSKILTVAFPPETAVWGSILAFLFATGLGMAFVMTGLLLVLIIGSMRLKGRARAAIGLFCGLTVVTLGILNITGYMIEYKSFVLGLFTP